MSMPELNCLVDHQGNPCNCVIGIKQNHHERSDYEEAMRKRDERREKLARERDALLVVLGILSEELSMLRKSYEKDSQP